MVKLIAYATIALALLTSVSPASFADNGRKSPIIASISQRTVSISKISAKTSAQAILLAEKKNPGWKVVSIKEHSKHWGLTMKPK